MTELVGTKNCRSEILRATQKDDELIEHLYENINEILLKLRKGGFLFRNRDNIRILAKLLYYSLTSMSNLQTLGEEYTGIIRTSCTRRHLPSFPLHFMWLILELYGNAITKKTVNTIEDRVTENPNVVPESKEEIVKALRIFSLFLPVISQLNQTWFYFRGKYYDIPRRLTGITYVNVFPFEVPSGIFKILGITAIVTSIIKFYQDFNASRSENFHVRSMAVVPSTSQDNILDDLIESNSKCSFCLEPPKNITLTPCGHLFCWDCIADPRNASQECPNCRAKISLSRNVALQNFI